MKTHHWRGTILLMGLLVCILMLQKTVHANGGTTWQVNRSEAGADRLVGDGICEVTEGLGDCTLQAAVEEANMSGSADTILIPSGTFFVDAELAIDDDLTIVGASQEETLIVKQNTYLLFNIGKNAALTVEKSALRPENDHRGQAFSVNGILILKDCVVTKFKHVLFSSGQVDVDQCEISFNRDGFDQGGLNIIGGSVKVANSHFEKNDGAIFAFVGKVFIENSYFLENTTRGNLFGGSGVVSGTDLTIIGSTFEKNSGIYGGAIAGYGKVLIANSTFTENTAANRGGGMYLSNTNGQIANITMVLNSAPTGNSIFLGGLSTSNTTWYNSIFQSIDDNCNVNLNSGGHNIFNDVSCGSANPADHSDQLANLLPNEITHGITPIHLPEHTSIAVDGGNQAICDSDLVKSVDQRGLSRTNQDGNMDGGNDNNRCDIGAVELQTTVPTAVTLTENSTASPSSINPLVLGIVLFFLSCLVHLLKTYQTKTATLHLSKPESSR